MTPEKLVDELDRVVKVPGLANLWVPPIRNRIDMLVTRIKSPTGVKISGTDLAMLDRVAAAVETAAKRTPYVSSALAERLTGGRYVDVDIDRAATSRFGLNIPTCRRSGHTTRYDRRADIFLAAIALAVIFLFRINGPDPSLPDSPTGDRD